MKTTLSRKKEPREQRPFLISFEGIEGSGKSVVSREVHRWLEKEGIPAILVREPGSTSISESIRRILLDPELSDMAPLTELLLYLAARAQLVAQVILPALKAGRSIICDRYLDASVAYQGWARGLGERLVDNLNRIVVNDAVPDRTFLLDLPAAQGLSRGPASREREGSARRDRIEIEKLEFHEKVREGYLRIARRNRRRILVIDASLPLDEVIGKAIEELQKLFRI